MQKNPIYTNVIENVRGFFQERIATLQKAGISPERVALDPGFGFGKTIEHNLMMLREMEKLRINRHPMAIGVSRKSMIARLLEALPIAPLPTAYFRIYGETSNQKWQEFLQFANHLHHREEIDTATATAVSAFDAIYDHMQACLSQLGAQRSACESA